MERICIAALTFFNAISYHTVDSIIYFCAGNSSAQQKFIYMKYFIFSLSRVQNVLKLTFWQKILILFKKNVFIRLASED